MKDSARTFVDVGLALTLSATLMAGGGCGRSSKTADVAQDSMLVRDADVAKSKAGTDTLTTPVKRSGGVVQMQPPTSPSYNPNMPQPKMQPPTRVNPVPILPGRDSLRKDSLPDSLSIDF